MRMISAANQCLSCVFKPRKLTYQFTCRKDERPPLPPPLHCHPERGRRGGRVEGPCVFRPNVLPSEAALTGPAFPCCRDDRRPPTVSSPRCPPPTAPACA